MALGASSCPSLARQASRIRDARGDGAFGQARPEAVRKHPTALPVQQRKRRETLRREQKEHPEGAATARERVRKWFAKEREYRREVRTSVLHCRLKYEMEYERDRQLVLEQKKADTFKRFVLQACQRKLQDFRVVNAEEAQAKWVSKTVLPRIGATARHAQKLAQTWETECDETEAMLTWRTADRFVYEVATSTVEEL